VSDWDLASSVDRRVAAVKASIDDFDAELPVPLTTFVQDKAYLANPPLSAVQYEAVRYAERIYFTETYALLAGCDDPLIAAYWREPCRMVNFLTMEWGKGSGKDHTSRIMSLRVAYLLLCLKSPQQYFAMPEQDTISLLNVATSSTQAQRAYFAPMRRAVARPGNWFQDVAEAVEASSARQRKETRALLNLIRFDKNVEAISGHSDADSQEGLNLIFGVADEVDGFKSRSELERERGARARESSSSAEAILDMLRTSASTRFPQTYKNVRISYPRYRGSTIQTLVARARLDNAERGVLSRHWVSGPLCTWDVNPRVTKKDFEQDYRDDLALALAKYECNPGRAINPYFGNELAIRDACVTLPRQPIVIVDYVRDKNAWSPFYDFAPPELFRPIQGARYAIHADLATTGNGRTASEAGCRAGVAMAHIVKMEERDIIGKGEQGQDIFTRQSRPIVKTDFVLSFEADAGQTPPREIQLRWFRELVFLLMARGFNIVQASADGYQSTDTAQILQAHGIEFKIRSTDRTDEHWSSLRDVCYEGRWSMPEREVAITELLGLSRLPNGKIDHLGDGSKDEADAIACSLSGALEVGGCEDEDGLQAWPGGSLQSWAGKPLFELPLGFVPPQLFRPDEVMPQQVALDGRGMPMWLPTAEMVGNGQCPCRGSDGRARCMECRLDAVPRMQ
jgi:hypothetical protein